MNVDIREITESDIRTIFALMREFAEFEKLGGLFETNEEMLRAAMFGKDGFVRGLIAFSDDAAAGYALFYPCFASFRGQRGLFLEDLYISSEYRRSGLGRIMLNEIARFAKANGFTRIDFQVLDWNDPAINFYLKLGAVRDNDTHHFKFTDAAFNKLAGSEFQL